MSKIERLSLFPLGIVLYPAERLPLHIFELRYKEMTARCLKTQSPFGIVFFDEGKIAQIGCTARITHVLERYEDGRMDLLVDGEQRFEVLDMFNDESYLTADVETMDEPEEPLNRALQQRMITQHTQLLELAGRTVHTSLYKDQDHLSFVIAANVGLTPQQKQEVLELLTENQRIDYLIGHLEGLIPKVEHMEDLRLKIQSNGHFKDFPPEAL